jgi:hypothetical protein
MSNPTFHHPVTPTHNHSNLPEAVATAMHHIVATINNNLLTSNKPHRIRVIKMLAVDADTSKDTSLHNTTQISTNNNTTLTQMPSHAVGEVDVERLHSMAHLRNSDASCINQHLISKAISTRVNTSTLSLRRKSRSLR